MASSDASTLLDPQQLQTLSERVIFTRHGRTKHNLDGLLQGSQDVSLADDGRDDARRMAAGFADADIRVVFTSPLKRAAETAQIIASENGLPEPVVIRELHECNYGDWEGQPKEALQVRPDRTEWFAGPVSAGQRGVPDGGEPYLDLLARVNGALEQVLDALPADGSALVVAHAGVLRAARFLRVLSDTGVRELGAEAVIPHETLVFQGDARDIAHAAFRI